MSKDVCRTKGCNLFPYKNGYCFVCVKNGLDKGGDIAEEPKVKKKSK